MALVHVKKVDQPAPPHSLISVFVIHYLPSIIVKLIKYNMFIILVSVAEQVEKRFTWSCRRHIFYNVSS